MASSALLLARYRNDLDEVARLRPLHGELDVFEAAALGDADRLAALLDADASLVHAWSPDGAQPLHLAAFFGYPDAVRVLLARGADPRVHATGFNNVAPINSAAAGDAKAAETSTEIVGLLLEAGADPNAAQGGGATALHAAALTRNAGLARLLLAHGADPAARTDDGRTPRDLWPELDSGGGASPH